MSAGQSEPAVVRFADAAARDARVTGGKGANLAMLTGHGLPVPPGFVVTVAAYEAFAASVGLAEKVQALLARLDANAEHIEQLTEELRGFITASEMPATVAQDILIAYHEMAAGAYVAVRSSGTAEDLEGASFAGLHDTYLDIRGDAVLLDAVKRCWASMWTARATSYRQSKQFDQGQAKIAVVVQQMIDGEIAGVMFTANPLTSATDEIVVNAAYGLGEALVSGIATPDEHVLDGKSLRVKEERTGAKEVRVIRDRDSAYGTITQLVPAEERARFALNSEQLLGLGRLGQDVMARYGGFPQDIEWVIGGGVIYLLQARPITGIEFSWDEDMEHWQTLPDDDEILWTRSWADELWNGAISPLAYSYRGPMFTVPAELRAKRCGIKGKLPQRMYKYRQGEIYFNTASEQFFIEHTTLPAIRAGLLAHTTPDKKDDILNGKFSVARYVYMHLHMLWEGYGPYKWLRVADDYLENRIAEANGKSNVELAALSDAELEREFETFVDLKIQFCRDLDTGFFIYARDSISFLGLLVARWYDGEDPAMFATLLSGLPKRTKTSQENLWLWRLAEQIRTSPALSWLFREAGENYLTAFESVPEGKKFLADYRAFVAENAHRGHADRDLWYDRRSENPAIDYETFRMMLNAQSADPEEREHQVNVKRNEAIAEMRRRLQAQRFGWFRNWCFNRLLNYTHRFFLIRDDQRYYFDRYTFAMKRIALEIGRRLTARRLFANPEDAYFLTRPQLYDALLTGQLDTLTRAKMKGRRHHFNLMLAKQAFQPDYLRRNRPVNPVTASASEDGVLRGVGTARGRVTARARIVKDLREIGQVQDGDILVTNSTDPGWTPVFNLLKGIVLETGGMLAHGSCLAREYGLPAVQLAGAMQTIPDGAIITVNGDTGEVQLHEAPAFAA